MTRSVQQKYVPQLCDLLMRGTRKQDRNDLFVCLSRRFVGYDRSGIPGLFYERFEALCLKMTENYSYSPVSCNFSDPILLSWKYEWVACILTKIIVKTRNVTYPNTTKLQVHPMPRGGPNRLPPFKSARTPPLYWPWADSATSIGYSKDGE